MPHITTISLHDSSIYAIRHCLCTQYTSAHTALHQGKLAETVAKKLNINLDKWSVHGSSWRDQFEAAVTIPSDGCLSVCLHLLALPWKLAVAFFPPPYMCGGWGCYLVPLLPHFPNSQIPTQRHLNDTVKSLYRLAL
jgi:hypothetical protein